MFTCGNKNLQSTSERAKLRSSSSMTRPAEVCDADSEPKSQEDARKSPEQSESNLDAENDEKPLEIDTSIDKTETTVSSDNLNSSSTSGTKRTSDSDSSATHTKKVRTKPKPQVIEDMKEYLDNNTIDKLTTTTLLHWLKGKSVHCTTRDKKAVLIQKVQNFYSEEQ